MPQLLPYAFQLGVAAQRDILFLAKKDIFDRDLTALEKILKTSGWSYQLCARPGAERGWSEGTPLALFVDGTGGAYDAVCARFERKNGTSKIAGVTLYLYPLARAIRDRESYEAAKASGDGD